MTEQRCPWQWRHLHCALPPRHPSPHHIVGEQPDFDRVEKTIAQQERERLRQAFASSPVLPSFAAWPLLRGHVFDLLAEPTDG